MRPCLPPARTPTSATPGPPQAQARWSTAVNAGLLGGWTKCTGRPHLGFHSHRRHLLARPQPDLRTPEQGSRLSSPSAEPHESCGVEAREDAPIAASTTGKGTRRHTQGQACLWECGPSGVVRDEGVATSSQAREGEAHHELRRRRLGPGFAVHWQICLATFNDCPSVLSSGALVARE
jgi:hypothetical protein